MEREKVLRLSSFCALGFCGVEQPIRIAYDRLRPPRGQKSPLLYPDDWKEKVVRELRDTDQVVNSPPAPSGLKRMGALLVGYQPTGPVVYRLSRACSFTPQAVPSWCSIGVTGVADAVFSRDYSNDLSMDAAQRLALRALSETADKCVQVGPPFRMAIITSTGYVEIPQDKVDALLASIKTEFGGGHASTCPDTSLAVSFARHVTLWRSSSETCIQERPLSSLVVPQIRPHEALPQLPVVRH